MFALLISWLNSFFSPKFEWFRDVFTRFQDIVERWKHSWAWIMAAIFTAIAMTVDFLDWVGEFLDFVLEQMTGIDLGSPLMASHSFHSAYGFANYVFPVEEIVSSILLLASLWFIVNLIRLIRAVLSLIQVAGFGVNN